VGLWNPYTGALVPETDGLQLWVTGLPEIRVRDTQGSNLPVNLQNIVGDSAESGTPLKLLLPWPAASADDERASWLPGRVYNWSLTGNGANPADGLGNEMVYGERNLGISTGLIRDAGPPLVDGTTSSPVFRSCSVGDPVSLVFELRRASDGAVLATFRAPEYAPFVTPLINETEDRVLDFAFEFRLADPDVDGVSWLRVAGSELQSPIVNYVQPGNAFDPGLRVVFAGGTTGVQIPGGVGNPSLLLDRYPGSLTAPSGTDATEDVPIFELPRLPLLSVAQLQHFEIIGVRPFWVGSSESSAGPSGWNGALFDQHFFSGAGKGAGWVDVTRPLPNTLAHVLRRKPDGSAVTASDFSAGATTAKFILQGGSFNLNSTEQTAWAAVLRSVRFTTGSEFTYLDSDPLLGTNVDTSTKAMTAAAAFPRFGQSAQEAYAFTPSYPQSDSNPDALTHITLDTQHYRQGMRVLDATEIQTFSRKITELVEMQLAQRGPIRSLEEFLAPPRDENGEPLFVDSGGTAQSLLERAISDAGLNPVSMPFSSSFLTQADVMTAIGPVLFARSDTFTVRAYGEAVNPATNLPEGRAWCEAIVQRLPEPFSPAMIGQPTDAEYQNPPGNFGRRFKIISFRWLTRSEI
jgi:hypothetical protein